MPESVYRPGLVLLLMVACGGGSNSSPRKDASNPTPGADAATSACANLACLQQVEDLMFGCAGGGTCVEQQDSTALPITTNECFDNGVRILATEMISSAVTSSSTTLAYKVKKGDALCFTRTFVSSQSYTDGGLVSGIDITLEDASGTTLVTASEDSNNVVTVTCPGGQPTVFVDSCGYDSSAANGAYVTLGATPPTCTQGSCSF